MDVDSDFALGLGKSMGRFFKYFSHDVQNKILKNDTQK